MTRFLTIASMLFASTVVAQVEIPHVHENGDVIDADEINQNLDIVAKAVPPRDCSTDQIIKWNGSAWVCAGFGFGTNTQRARGGRENCTGRFVSEVILTAGDSGIGIPAYGQLLRIDRYPELYSILDTRYGGDGSTTFALPDLRDVAPDGMTYSICLNGKYPLVDTVDDYY